MGVMGNRGDGTITAVKRGAQRAGNTGVSGAPPPSSLQPGSAPLVLGTVAQPFRLGQQGDNEQVKEMAGTGAKGALSSPLQDNEASAPQEQPL